MSEHLIDTMEAARRLKLGRRSIVMLIQKGQLPATRVGRVWMVKPADLAHIPRGQAGRPPRITAEQWALIEAACEQDPIARVAERFGIHESTIHRRRARRRRE